MPVDPAQFDLNRCNESLLWGENPDFWPLTDDISLMAGCTDDLQQLVNKVYTSSDKFGLTVSSTKTEVQCIQARDEDHAGN